MQFVSRQKIMPLSGGLLVGKDGADERGARPSNNAPDSLQLARQNKDGSPDYHGWPDRYGFLPTSQRVFNPVGGPGDDLCVADPTNPPSNCTPASLAQILAETVPIRDVLAFPPQPITSPLAIEAADSSFTGIDFVPDSFVRGPVQRGAALYTLEGDFGFSAGNGTPEVGHEVKLINFSRWKNRLSSRLCGLPTTRRVTKRSSAAHAGSIVQRMSGLALMAALG